MFAKEGYPTMALVTAISAVIIYVTLTFLDHWISYLIVTTVFHSLDNSYLFLPRS